MKQQGQQQCASAIQDIVSIIDEVSGIAVAIAAAIEERLAVTTELAITLQQTTGHTQ
ncbi:MAG TPA: hypothetical protein VIL09_09395 [Microvirga sp.]